MRLSLKNIHEKRDYKTDGEHNGFHNGGNVL